MVKKSHYSTKTEQYIRIIEEESLLTEIEIEELVKAKREALKGLLSKK